MSLVQLGPTPLLWVQQWQESVSTVQQVFSAQLNQPHKHRAQLVLTQLAQVPLSVCSVV